MFWVQSCQESSKDKTYKSYMGKVSDVAGSSQQIGKQLSQVLLAQGLKEAQVEQRVSGLAHQEQLDVQRARAITPPGTLRDEHQALIQALQFRVSGLNGLASALAATANTKDATRAGTVLASQMQRLLASDVIYQDSFKAPSAAELDRQGVTGTNDAGGPLIPDSNFLQSSDLVTPTAMVTVISRIRGGTSTPSSGGLRGTNLVSVKVQPAGTELSTSSQTTVVVRTNMSIDVTVEDSGDSQEANIPVTLRIIQAGVPHGRSSARRSASSTRASRRRSASRTSRRRASRTRRRSRSRFSPFRASRTRATTRPTTPSSSPSLRP